MTNDLKRYFKQQAELYGDDLPRYYEDLLGEEHAPAPAAQPEAKLVQTQTAASPSPPSINPVAVKSPPPPPQKPVPPPAPVLEKPLIQDGERFPVETAQSLLDLYDMVNECMACQLGSCRKNFVFGKGNQNADILVVGEAPGQEEDERGKPFVGKAGQLLDKMLAAINLGEENTFITNVVKCRPPSNRDPEPAEIAACNTILQRQLQLIKPKLILSLGRVSGRTLLGSTLSLSNMRGKFHSYNNVPLLITYHPSALLRNEKWKRPAWEDLQAFRKRYDEILAR